MCVELRANAEKSGYIPLSFIKQLIAIITPLNSLRNDKQISEVFSPLISDLLLAERQADKDDNKPS